MAFLFLVFWLSQLLHLFIHITSLALGFVCNLSLVLALTSLLLGVCLQGHWSHSLNCLYADTFIFSAFFVSNCQSCITSDQGRQPWGIHRSTGQFVKEPCEPRLLGRHASTPSSVWEVELYVGRECWMPDADTPPPSRASCDSKSALSPQPSLYNQMSWWLNRRAWINLSF